MPRDIFDRDDPRPAFDPHDPIFQRPLPRVDFGGPLKMRTLHLLRRLLLEGVQDREEGDEVRARFGADLEAFMVEMKGVLRSPWCRADPELRLLESDMHIVRQLRKERGRIATVPGCIIGGGNLWRLNPCEPLNDELVNIYVHMMRARAVHHSEQVAIYGTDDDWPDVHLMISGFWAQAEKGWEAGRLARLMERQEVDIFTKDLFLFPAFVMDMHWRACAVNIKEREIAVYDAKGWNAGIRDFFEGVEDFLRHEEARVKKIGRLSMGNGGRKRKRGSKSAVGERGDGPEDGAQGEKAGEWQRVIVVKPDSPHQQAAYDSADDCGVFALQWLEAVARGREFKLKQKDMVAVRTIMTLEIGLGKLLPRE